MKEPRWIPESAIKAMHAELIAEHGGDSGTLNLGLLSSTLTKPKNLFFYGENITLFDLAAAYGYGLAKNHCFVDGNKRIALTAVDVFLRLNGYELIASEVEAAAFFLDLASRLETPEEGQSRLTNWIKNNSRQLL